MPLFELLRRISGYGEVELRSPENQKTVEKDLETIRETAHHGRIKVWGREGIRREEYISNPRTEIPPEYWRKSSISYDGLLNNFPDGRTWTYGKSYGDSVFYSDLHFSRTQIDKIWQPPRNKFTMQWPILIKLQH